MFYKTGGKPIGSGTYGCVFFPALKCTNKTKKQKSKSKVPLVSKLMTEKNMLTEYNEIQEIKKALETLPGFHKYFLLSDVSYCQPKKLQRDDFIDFNDKCKSSKFEKQTINKNIKNYFILNMPYGGDTVKDFLIHMSDNSHFIDLNNQFIDLMNEAILPMNNKHVYHSDLKDNNILIKMSGDKIENLRIIDWGLAAVSDNFDSIPKRWQNRPLQFNAPFSCVLFFSEFLDQFNPLFIKRNGYMSDEFYGKLLQKYLDFLIRDAPGHYFVIHDFLKQLFMFDMPSYNKENTNDIIINYLREILKHFSHMDTGGFNFEFYITSVYSHILDVYGLLTNYWTLIELIAASTKPLEKTERKLFHYLKSFLLKYMFNPRVKPYDMKNLQKDMTYINQFFDADTKQLEGSIGSIELRSRVLSQSPKTPQNIVSLNNKNIL